MPRQGSNINSKMLTILEIHMGQVPENFPEELKKYLPTLAQSLDYWINEEDFGGRILDVATKKC